MPTAHWFKHASVLKPWQGAHVQVCECVLDLKRDTFRVLHSHNTFSHFLPCPPPISVTSCEDTQTERVEKKNLHKWDGERQDGSASVCLMTEPLTPFGLFKYDSPVSTIIISLTFTLHTQQPASWHIITHLLIVEPCR